MARPKMMRGWFAGAVALGFSLAAVAAPPRASGLAAQVANVDAQITAARTQNTQLQTEVTQLEQHNAAQQQQLQQRDAEIAALQKKLQAAGVPAAAGSAGH